MPTHHRIYIDPALTPIPNPGDHLTLTGDEAFHALKVKRIQPIDLITLLDGQGTTAQATIADIHHSKTHPKLQLLIQSSTHAPPPDPYLHVYAPTPKANHADELVDALSQLGAAAWTPLQTTRTVVDPRQTKLERLQRIATEAAKQSGRPYLLKITPKANLKDITQNTHPNTTTTIVAHQQAPPYTPPPHPSSSSLPQPTQIRLILGPEGGLTDDELKALIAAGAIPANFGPLTMRIETAALAAAAIIINAHMAQAQ